MKILIRQDGNQNDLQEEFQKHNCNSVGHQMRVFAGGHYIKKEKGKDAKIPSLHTCDIIDPFSPVVIDGQKLLWREVLKTRNQDWEIIYNKDTNNQKQKIFDSFWAVIGQEYCNQKKYKYRQRIKDIQELTQIHQSKVVVIALDSSYSMQGEPWDNVVKQAKIVIDFMQQNHKNKRDVRLVIIFFTEKDDIKEVYDKNLDEHVGDIWQFQGGCTNFDPPFKLGFRKIKEYIDDKEQGELHFFTDGQALYPHQAFNEIQDDLLNYIVRWYQNKSLKLRFFIYCLDDQNVSLESFSNDLNTISQQQFGDDICRIQQEVNLDQLGELMIENFIFNY